MEGLPMDPPPSRKRDRGPEPPTVEPQESILGTPDAASSSVVDAEHFKHFTQISDLLEQVRKSTTMVTPAQQTGDVPFTAIDLRHYHTKAACFIAWVHDVKRMDYSTFTHAELRELFLKFCLEWNYGRLPAYIYRQGASQNNAALVGMEVGMRTSYRWGYATRMSPDEKMELASVVDKVAEASATSWSELNHVRRQRGPM